MHAPDEGYDSYSPVAIAAVRKQGTSFPTAGRFIPAGVFADVASKARVLQLRHGKRAFADEIGLGT
jgi:hypothetical protein